MGDYGLAKKWYRTKAKGYQGMYINPVNLEMLDNLEKKEKKEIIIQVGNSADPSNNYEEVFELIEKFKGENIKIIVPLSYGNKEYAKKINQLGQEIFGNKFEGLMKFMKPEEYTQHLSSVDILIFNHKRQQGLGNIYALAYLEKKIYIRDDISSWNFLKKDLGFEINSTNKIKIMDFKEFIFVNGEKSNKTMALNTVYSEIYIKNLWNKIFKE